MNSSRRRSLALGAILLVALGLRIAYTQSANLNPKGTRFDDTAYRLLGRNLASGYGYTKFLGPPTAMWPPGYPFFLSLVFRSGGNLKTVQIVQAILGALTCAATFMLGARLFTPAHGLLGAAILAVCPEAVTYTPLVLSETLFATLFTGLLVLFVAWNDRSDLGSRRWIWFGIAVGLTAYVRGIGLAFVLVPLFIWSTTADSIKHTCLKGLAVAAGIALVVLPWTLRNHLVFGFPVLLSTQTGEVLSVAHSDIATGGLTIWDAKHDRAGAMLHLKHRKAAKAWRREIPAEEREVIVMREETARAVKYFLSHPGREVELIIPRIRFLYRHGHRALAWGRKRDEKTGGDAPIFGESADAWLRAGADSYFYGLLGLALK